MAEYKLYCMGESGNSYKPALMLELCGLNWEPVWVDYFNGETRTDSYRERLNEMGEVPVLEHGDLKLTQSGVILDYLAEKTGKFGATGDQERREIWRWILFDNHKLTSYVSTLRFMIRFAKTGETPVTAFLRERIMNNLQIVDKHLGLQPFLAGGRATIADFSMCGYLYFGDELPFELAEFGHVLAWLERIRSIPRWKHPYDLMPRQKS